MPNFYITLEFLTSILVTMVLMCPPELKNAAEYLRSVQEEDGMEVISTPVEIEEPALSLHPA